MEESQYCPILKKGDQSSASNYRNVSLLPLLSKVLEKVVYLSFVNHVQPVLTSQEHGFMPRRKCVTNLEVMLPGPGTTYLLALRQTLFTLHDYSSAFQSVNHQLVVSHHLS